MPDNNILARIMTQKTREIETLRVRAENEGWQEQWPAAPPGRDFCAALATGARIGVIAEIKKASPSAGILRADFDPVAIANSYAGAGAACLSVLTDQSFFQGSIADLRAVRQAVALPILRKDFILDAVQILEARLAGASAVLLIAECLGAARLRPLVETVRSFGMEPLVEFHDAANLPLVLEAGSRLVGINNRNLRTFATDLGHTLRLLERIPDDRIVVSESGIRQGADVRRLEDAGVDAILVGEVLMREPDPGRKLRELMDA